MTRDIENQLSNGPGDITKISDRHHEIAMRKLAGETQNEIAEGMGYTANRISIIINSPLFITFLTEMRIRLREKFLEKKAEALVQGDPANDMLEAGAFNAAATIVRSVVNPKLPMNTRLRSARDILDRTGRAKTEKIEQHTMIGVDKEALDKLSAVLKETDVAREAGIKGKFEVTPATGEDRRSTADGDVDGS